ncbi:MAG: HWE histidine kinase domain-containing protein, partial [Janthinobacterium lividum]
RSATSLNDFVENLDGRIRSMAKAHSLLTQSHWAGVSLAALASDELDPYGRGGADIVVDGPTVVLSPKSSLALSLAMHELATNAAKYGSLSRPGGRVSIRWGVADDGGLHVVWREAGGPVVQEPKRRGFGTRLIEKALAMETRGRSTIHFDPDGVVCEITLPKAAIISVTAAASPPAAAWADIIEAVTPPPPMRPRILVVEDSALVIMSLEECFDELGWDMVGPATTVAEALILALEEDIDAALLDINLNDEMSWPIASILVKRGVPFAFATGYDARMVLPEALQNIPVISKPYNLKDVELRLRTVLSPVK